MNGTSIPPPNVHFSSAASRGWGVQSLQPQLKAQFLFLVLVQSSQIIHPVYVQLFHWRPQQPWLLCYCVTEAIFNKPFSEKISPCNAMASAIKMNIVIVQFCCCWSHCIQDHSVPIHGKKMEVQEDSKHKRFSFSKEFKLKVLWL